MTGGTTCCVPGCAHTTLSAKHVYWNRFLKDGHLRNIWVQRINRKGTAGRFSMWTRTSDSRICGAHFNETERKKYEGKAPRFFPTRTLPKYVAACPKVPNMIWARKRHTLHVTLPASQEPPQPGSPLASSGAPDTDDVIVSGHLYSITGSVDQALRDRIRQLEEHASANEKLRKDNDLAHLEEMNDKAEEIIDATIPFQSLTLTVVPHDPKKLAFYTGFDSLERFLAFYKFVQSGYEAHKESQGPQRKSPCLSMDDQLLLVLSRPRVGLLEQDLVYRFRVHISTVSRINLHWRECAILQARPLRNSGSAPFTFDGTSLPFHVGLGSFTVWVQPFRRQTWVCDTCHCIEHRSALCPNSTQANGTTQRHQSPSSTYKEKPASPPATPETSSRSASFAHRGLRSRRLTPAGCSASFRSAAPDYYHPNMASAPTITSSKNVIFTRHPTWPLRLLYKKSTAPSLLCHSTMDLLRTLRLVPPCLGFVPPCTFIDQCASLLSTPHRELKLSFLNIQDTLTRIGQSSQKQDTCPDFACARYPRRWRWQVATCACARQVLGGKSATQHLTSIYLLDRRIRLLVRYRRSRRPRRLLKTSHRLQKTISCYTSELASNCWTSLCSSIPGNSHIFTLGMDSPFTLHELEAALDKANTRSAPGPQQRHRRATSEPPYGTQGNHTCRDQQGDSRLQTPQESLIAATCLIRPGSSRDD
ncbi:hypothetical protein HPB47_000776 [Ixodes persulcatus]|uniref:Uncharacterized protein n=1 Tax=Ixodes persulcatus TaxID=34615 RepID=A0AC60PQS7_IXOPE|nr:hypothetical protein HPB47_000776 [Ixodes persulcatus]